MDQAQERAIARRQAREARAHRLADRRAIGRAELRAHRIGGDRVGGVTVELGARDRAQLAPRRAHRDRSQPAAQVAATTVLTDHRWPAIPDHDLQAHLLPDVGRGRAVGAGQPGRGLDRRRQLPIEVHQRHAIAPGDRTRQVQVAKTWSSVT